MNIKRTTRLLALGLVVCWIAVPNQTWAQPATGPAQRGPGERGDGARRGGAPFLERFLELVDELHLSEEQKVEAKQIVDAAREQLRITMQEVQDLEPRERAQRMRAQMNNVREQLVAILDEEQRELLRQRMQERPAFQRGLRGERGQGGAAADAPATQPATPEARLAALAQRFRQVIDQLELSEDQKSQAVKVADELRTKMQALRAQAQDDLEKLRTTAREYFNEARLELQEILSPEQQQKFRELMQQGMPGQRPDRPERMGRPERPDRPERPQDPAAPQDQPDKPEDNREPDDGRRAMAPPPAEVQAGQPAAEFALEKLDGRPVQLSSFKGRILVVLFGNYSSPTFRDRAPEYESLRRQFGNRADFLIVYTRESHAVGEWEVDRNKRARVRVEQPQSIEERKALARQAKQALKITSPIAIDTMDDKTATDYGGFTTSAVIVGRDGTILGYRKYADVHALKRMLEEAIGS